MSSLDFHGPRVLLEIQASDVDAVIAALRVVLHEAETRTNRCWETHIVNKRWGRWRELRLRPDCGDLAGRPNLIMHVRATLAYLETNRETIAAQRSWWPFGRRVTNPVPETPAAVVKDEPAPPQKPWDNRGYRTGRRSPSG